MSSRPNGVLLRLAVATTLVAALSFSSFAAVLASSAPTPLPSEGSATGYTSAPCCDRDRSSISPTSGSTGPNSPWVVVATPTVGGDPVAVVADSGANDVFVANEASDTVTVLSGATGAFVATIPVGEDPDALAYDSIVNEVFVANYGSGNVSVLSDSSDTVIATVSVGSNPDGIAYDVAEDEMFVANFGTSNVSVICDASTARSPCYTGTGTPPDVIATVPLGSGAFPRAITYDTWLGEAWVAVASDALLVIPESSDTVTATVGLGAAASSVAFDPIYRDVYAASPTSNSVSVVADASNSVVTTLPMGTQPSGIAYDPTLGLMLVAGFGTSTASVVYDTTEGIVGTVPVGDGPLGVAYDRTSECYFVANSGSNTVSVISATRDRSVGSTPLPTFPVGAAFDPGLDEVFATNDGPGTDNVTVLSGSTSATVGSIAVGSSPRGLAYDAGHDELYVANSASGNVTVLSLGGSGPARSVRVGDLPTGVAYDSARGEVFVTNTYTANVSVINDTSRRVVASIDVGLNPMGIVYDRSLGELFVANFESDNVSVISDASNSVLTSVPVGSNPDGIALDPTSGDVYVANTGQDNVTVISAANDEVVTSIPVGSYPTALALDPATGEMLVSNQNSDNVSAIWDVVGKDIGSTPVGTDPLGIVYDSVDARTYVLDEGSGNATVLEAPVPTFSVTFEEVGLGPSTTWYVNGSAAGSHSTALSTLGFAVIAGTDEFSVGGVPGESANATPATVTVSDSAVTVYESFTVTDFPVTFTESGLPSGLIWWVYVDNVPPVASDEPSLSMELGNGSYTYTAVTATTGFAAITGSVSVRGSGPTVGLAFSAHTSTYLVTFTESGLPPGSTWWANLTGGISLRSTSSTISVSLPNGTFSLRAASFDRSFTVSGPTSAEFSVSGAAVDEAVLFASRQYPVSFFETGLPTGTSWKVQADGVLGNSTTANIVFDEPDGTVSYSVEPVAGYSPSPSSGGVAVAGAPSSQAITFTAVAALQLSITISPNTSAAPEPGPLLVSFDASATGGTGPYSYAWSLGDGASAATASTSHTYDAAGTYLAQLTVTDSVGDTKVVAIPVRVGTAAEMTTWIPALDAYNFGNPGSLWAAGGNCYGLSSTAVLYFEHDALENASAPDIPDDAATYPDPLPYISEAQAQVAQGGFTGNPWVRFDNVSLAIYLHQISGLNSVRPSTWVNSVSAADVLSALARTGTPVVIALGPNDLHGVVVYGAQTYSNGSDEFLISDPNTADAALTTHAWFVPPDSFRYEYGDSWSRFSPISIGSFAATSSVPVSSFYWAAHGLAAGWQLVEADRAVTVSSNGVDRFADADAGNSQTFVQGIRDSSGIEEPTATGISWQAYVVPPGDPPVSVDPADTSDVRLYYGLNVSGVPSLRGFGLQVEELGVGSVLINRTSAGVTLTTGSSGVVLNVTILQANDSGWQELQASGLNVGAHRTAVLSVDNWSQLNATSVAVGALSIGPSSGTGPNQTYVLSNGQQTLGAPVPFAVTFAESGLATGTEWSVELNGTVRSGSGTTIVFSDPGGEYSYAIEGVAGYSTVAPAGSVTVSGAPVERTVVFTPNPATAPPTVPRLWIEVGGVAGGAAVLAAVVWVRRRSRRRNATGPPADPAGGSAPRG